MNTSAANSTGPDFSSETSLSELYVVMVLLIILSVFGTIGNFLVLYVFAQKKDRLTSTIFILALAFVDLTTCMVIVPFTVYMEYIKFRTRIDIICKIYQGLITSTIPFSALLMAAIAVDRYFCICHPFLHAINIRRAKIMCVFLGMIATGLGLITGLAHGVYAKKTLCHDTPLEIVMNEPSNATMNAAGFYKGSNISLFDTEETSELTEYDHYLNTSARQMYNSSRRTRRDCIVHTYMRGVCDLNVIIVHENFMWVYHKIYTALFMVVLIIVSVLYVLIYNSVMQRRKKRQKQKKHLPAIPMTTTDEPGLLSEETQITTTAINGNMEVKNGSAREKEKEKENPTPSGGSAFQTHQRNRKSTKSKKDRNRVANIKTAAMLFVVTMVFVVTYLPAFLMVLQLIDYNMTAFYMYFANNVANPVIYSFMNKNFRDDLKKIFKCKA